MFPLFCNAKPVIILFLTIPTDFMIVDQKLARKPDNPIEGYLARSFEVQISCQEQLKNQIILM